MLRVRQGTFVERREHLLPLRRGAGRMAWDATPRRRDVLAHPVDELHEERPKDRCRVKIVDGVRDGEHRLDRRSAEVVGPRNQMSANVVVL